MAGEGSVQSIKRKDLLTAILTEPELIDRIEIKEITLAAQQAAGLHRHPCLVAGYIVSGTIEFQIEGQPSRLLRKGDAFLEPADVPIARFDNITLEPTTFVAFYLLGKDDSEIIEMLEARTANPET